ADAARAVAGPLHDRADLFPENPEPPERTLYVHALAHPVEIDGYTDDWLSWLSWSATYSAPGGEGFRLIASRRDPWYYGLLQVRDADVVLQPQSAAPDSLEGDYVILVVADARGETVRYHFSATGPGRVSPFRFIVNRDEYGFESRTTEYATRIAGAFQPVAGGYNLEFAVPVDLVGERMALVVADVDPGAPAVSMTGSAGAGSIDVPARILEPSQQIVRVIRRFAEAPGRRLWVLDAQSRVLASVGGLERTLPDVRGGIFYRLILPPAREVIEDDRAGVSRLQSREVQAALAGGTESRWRSAPDGETVIVSAATPVYSGESVRGVVVVEETTGGIQMLQREAMISLFNKTALVFAVVAAALLLFATALSWRLRRLARDADAAIDEHGRVAGGFRASAAGDEIGDLSRTYAGLLARLEEYNRYLEGLAGRLSHELRTPITIVRTSLEHLRDGAGPEYLDRAREGVKRLDLIVTRLSEAARLEQALQQASTERMDVRSLLERCVAGLRLAYPGMPIDLSLPGVPLEAAIAPDLFEQMLEKLIANAADFREPGSGVAVALEIAPGAWIVSVSNSGPPLPENMEAQLFQSMVSVRERDERQEPHLGLGLYIVRLIAEFHAARAGARNLPQGGVRFEVVFPGDAS
ncbi:MAG TPA: ATP-binding protein, partial [Gammaproteobacteria bacterium]